MNDVKNIPDCLFPSDNDLEVQTLRMDMQPEFCEIPFVCFGEQARTFDMRGNGTLHFYTDDYRFSAIWEKPEKILQQHPSNIVEPNFSLYSETPIAFGLQNIYKKRFIARAMQEAGIGVFVDLNVNSKFYKLNMLGVPVGYHSFCTRGYSNRGAYLEFEYKMAREWAADNADRLLFVIYGGGKMAKDFAKKNRCVYVEQLVNVKNKLKSIEDKVAKISGTIAFQDGETERILEAAMNEHKQVLDYTNKQLE